MNEEIAQLRQALSDALELNRLLSERVKILETPVEDNAARMVAVMTLLRAVCQCAPNRDQIVQMTERMVAQMQVQPGILSGPGSGTFQKVKEQLDSLTVPAAPLD